MASESQIHKRYPCSKDGSGFFIFVLTRVRIDPNEVSKFCAWLCAVNASRKIRIIRRTFAQLNRQLAKEWHRRDNFVPTMTDQIPEGKDEKGKRKDEMKQKP